MYKTKCRRLFILLLALVVWFAGMPGPTVLTASAAPNSVVLEDKAGLKVEFFPTGIMYVWYKDKPQFYPGKDETDPGANGVVWRVGNKNYGTHHLAPQKRTGLTSDPYVSLKNDLGSLGMGTLKKLDDQNAVQITWEKDGLVFAVQYTVKPYSNTIVQLYMLTNKTDKTIKGPMLFTGGDTYFQGVDYGFGEYFPEIHTVAVYRSADSGMMSLTADPTTLDSAHFAYEIEDDGGKYAAMNAGKYSNLSNQTWPIGKGKAVDMAYYMQWNMTDLPPGQTKFVGVTQQWSASGEVMMIAPLQQTTKPGNTVAYTFTLKNVTSQSAKVSNLRVTDTQFPAELSTSEITIPPYESRTVTVRLKIPNNTPPTESDTLTLRGTYAGNKEVSAKTFTKVEPGLGSLDLKIVDQTDQTLTVVGDYDKNKPSGEAVVEILDPGENNKVLRTETVPGYVSGKEIQIPLEDLSLTPGKEYIVRMKVTDVAGPDEERFTSIVKETEKPTIKQPTEGDKMISGTGEPGDGGRLVVRTPDNKKKKEYKVTVDDKGDWTVNIPDGDKLDKGDRVLVETNDPKTGEKREVVEETVVGKPGQSEKPTIKPPTEGDKTISGTGKPGDEGKIIVEKPDGTKKEHKVTVDDKGEWTVTIPDGEELEKGGKVTLETNDPKTKEKREVVEETVVGKPGQSEKPTIKPPTEGDKTISGTGKPKDEGKAVVEKPDGTKKEYKVDVDDKGNWTVTIPDGEELEKGGKVTLETNDPKTGEKREVVEETVVGKPGQSEKPTIKPPTEGDKTISGTGKPGDEGKIIVEKPDGTKKEYKVDVDDKGNWTVTVPDGEKLEKGGKVTLETNDPKTGEKREVVEETVVGKPGQSEKPTIKPPTEGDKTISGTGKPGDEGKIIVEKPDGTKKEYKVDVDDKGNWTVTIPDGEKLEKGGKVTLETNDPKTGEKREVVEETVVGKPGQSEKPTIKPPTEGDKTISGTGKPKDEGKAVVEKPDGTKKEYKVDVDDKGNWTVTIPDGEELEKGGKVTLETNDPKTGEKREVVEETVVGKPGQSEKPTIKPPTEGDKTISGTGKPGDEGKIIVEKPDGTKKEYKVDVDDKGNWTVTVPDGEKLEKGGKVTLETNDPKTGEKREVVEETVVGKPGQSEKPTIKPPTEGDKTISGTGKPKDEGKAVVEKPDGTKKEYKVDVDDKGEWTVTIPDGEKLEKGGKVTLETNDPKTGEKREVVEETVVGKPGQSEKPTIKPPTEGDKTISGTGKPKDEGKAVVEKPDGTKKEYKVDVDDKGEWAVTIPDGEKLEKGGKVTLETNDPKTKEKREVVEETVVGKPGQSEKPTIKPPTEGDKTISGTGKPKDEGKAVVEKPDGTKKEYKVDVDDKGEWTVTIPDGEKLEKGGKVTLETNDPKTKEKREVVEETVVGKPGQSEKPTIKPPTEGDKTISGTGKPKDEGKAVVEKPDGTKKEYKVDVDDKGNWTVTVPDGEKLEKGGKVTLETNDPKTGEKQDVVEETVVGKPGQSEKPTIKPPTEGDKTISGTGKPKDEGKAVVEKPDGTKKEYKVDVDDKGNWTVTIPDGEKLEKGGKVTLETNDPKTKEKREVVEETVVGKPGQSEKPTIKPPTEGDKTISGTGKPKDEGKAVVEKPDGTKKEYKVDVDDKGNWTVTVPDGEKLEKGGKVTLETNDPKTKEKREVVEETVVGKPGQSEKPTIKPPTEGDKTISGTGKPKDEVKVVVKKPDGTEKEHKVTVDDKGNWTVTIPDGEKLDKGDEIKATAVNPETNLPRKDEAHQVVGDKTKRSGGGEGGQKNNGNNADLDKKVASGHHIAYITGYPDGTVRPEGNATRAEVAVMLYRLIEKDEKYETISNSFADVEAGKWYTQAICYLVDTGVLEGYPDGTFQPNGMITRAEFTTVIHKITNSASGNYHPFSDITDKDWAAEAIASVYEQGWVAGYPDGTFRTDAPITRAEAVKIINTVLKRGIDKDTLKKLTYLYPDLADTHWSFADIMEASIPHDYVLESDNSQTWIKW